MVELSDLARIVGRSVEELEAWRAAGSLADASIDSIEVFEVVLLVEDHYGIEFPEELLNSIDTFDELCHWIGVLRTQ